LRGTLALISHELRTPLNLIQSWSHVLENELSRTLTEESGRGNAIDASPATQRALAGIRIGVRDQVRLIDQLVDASGAMNGTLTLERRPLSLVPVLEAARASAQPLAAGRRVTLRADYDHVDAQVEGDADRLRQVVSHLLANAIKFTEPGSEVVLCLRRFGDDLVISVTDQGPGVPPEQRREIFGWFVRGPRGGGLGLGLALAQHFAHMHDGDIEVLNAAPGAGATFSLRLPEWPPAANEALASAPPDDRAAPPDRSAPADPPPPSSTG
jgi:signal transduction histidine kinase